MRLRDRAALCFSICKFDYVFVVLAVLICAVMFTAIRQGQFEVGRIGALGFHCLLDGSNERAIFRKVPGFCLEGIIINNPTPKVSQWFRGHDSVGRGAGEGERWHDNRSVVFGPNVDRVGYERGLSEHLFIGFTRKPDRSREVFDMIRCGISVVIPANYVDQERYSLSVCDYEFGRSRHPSIANESSLNDFERLCGNHIGALGSDSRPLARLKNFYRISGIKDQGEQGCRCNNVAGTFAWSELSPEDDDRIANSPYAFFKFIISVPCIGVGLYLMVVLLAHDRLTWSGFIVLAVLVAVGIFLMQDFIRA
jgi:hypothetical protein